MYVQACAIYVVHVEAHKKVISREKALKFRDSIAKALYSQLFEWIVNRCNARLRPMGVPEVEGSDQKQPCLSVLDIFGFECVPEGQVLLASEMMCLQYQSNSVCLIDAGRLM